MKPNFIKYLWNYEEIYGHHYINQRRQGGTIGNMFLLLLVGSVLQIPPDPVLNWTFGILCFGIVFLMLIFLWKKYKKFDPKTVKRRDIYTTDNDYA